MPPDTQADGPGGSKARRTRGPASPGQRTAQPFGGTLNASPLRCAPGAWASRGHSAGLPQAAATPVASVLTGVPRASRRPPPRAGHRPPAGISQAAAHAGPRPPAGIPQASRRPPPRAGHRPLAAPAGVPRAAVHAGHRPPAGVPRPTQAAATPGASVLAGSRRPPAGRRPCGASALAASRGHSAASRRPRPPPHPPAARFSRKPPCGIGPRMVYCT